MGVKDVFAEFCKSIIFIIYDFHGKSNFRTTSLPSFNVYFGMTNQLTENVAIQLSSLIFLQPLLLRLRPSDMALFVRPLSIQIKNQKSKRLLSTYKKIITQ